MKNVLIVMMIATAGYTASSTAPGEKYMKTMKESISELYRAQTQEEINTIVNKFVRIGEAETDRWRPWYYASYGSLMKAVLLINGDRSDMDLYLDESQGYLDMAMKSDHNKAEVIALQGYIHMIRVTVDPATRGQQYSGLAMQTFGKALNIEPENPRALLLMGQMRIGTAQFFGQEPTDGCAMVSQALTSFEEYHLQHELDPSWGREMAESIAMSCKGQ